MARFRTRPGHSVGREIVLDDRGPIGSIQQSTRKGRRSDVWAWSLYPSATSPRQFSGEARTRTEALNAIERAYTKREEEAPARFVGEAPRRGAPADATAANELVLYIENTSDLSPDGPRGQGRDVLLNALRKWRKGTYNPALAVKLFGYLVETGAKRYAKEFGSSEREWSTMFTPATRQEVARQLEASFRNSAERGEYDHVDVRTGAAARGIAVREPRRMRMRGSTLETLPVIFRFDDGEVTAVFPTLEGTGPNDFTVYSHNGQHSTGTRGWYNRTRPATPNEYASLFNEIKRIYEQGSDAVRLRVIERFPSHGPSRTARESSRSDDRPVSMTYGQLPPFEQFEQDIRRPDPDSRDGAPYWPPGTLYPMEIKGHEAELASDFGLDQFAVSRDDFVGFRGEEREIHDFIAMLTEEMENGDEEAGDLASSIMTTLGYEWI